MTSRPRSARPLLAALPAVLLSGACVKGPEVAAPPEAVANAREGGALVVGILQPQSIAPWTTSTFDPYGTLVVRTMCDSLTEHDPITGEAKPAVAETVRKQGVGATVVRLRENLKFSDGSTANADDVIASLSAVANATVASPVAEVVKPIAGFAVLNDPDALAKLRDKRPELAGLSSSEDRNVGIAADSPGFAAALSHPVAVPVKRAAFEKDAEALARSPLCVGPYVLAEPWEPGQPVIRLTRSKTYYGLNAAHTRGGRGWFDTIEFRVFPDRETVYQQYVMGAVDVAFIAPTQAAEARAAFPADYVEAFTGELSYVGLPLNTPPFDRPEVRRALSLALDRTAIAEAGRVGLGEPARGFLPPTLSADTFERPKRVKDSPCASAVPAKPRVAEAKRVLERFDVELGAQPIRLTYNDEFQNGAMAQEVARQWKDAFGVEVTVAPMAWEAWIEALRRSNEVIGAYRWTWDAEYGDPYLYLHPLFHTAEISRDNLSRFTDPFFDFSIEESKKKINDRSRLDDIQAAEAVVCLHLPMLPVMYSERALLIRSTRVASAFGTVLTDRSSGLPLLRDLYPVQP